MTEAFVERVAAMAEECYDDVIVFGPDTDLIAVAQQTDPEFLEHLLACVHNAFALTWPKGDCVRRLSMPQLFVPGCLTVRELAEVIEQGTWPENWTRPRKWVWRGLT